jgi:hypothetical protein
LFYLEILGIIVYLFFIFQAWAIATEPLQLQKLRAPLKDFSEFMQGDFGYG